MSKRKVKFGIEHFKIINVSKGAVTLGNFSCNLSRNFVATQVERNIAQCNSLLQTSVAIFLLRQSVEVSSVKNSFNESTTHNTMAAMKTQALLQSNTADNGGLESQVAQY